MKGLEEGKEGDEFIVEVCPRKLAIILERRYIWHNLLYYNDSRR